ncbi:hypothetical protein DS906_08510 [Ruegeria sp. A3M17]|nr:hypothetical protein DS906_08510 [Ruegeria sp. A3M17]
MGDPFRINSAALANDQITAGLNTFPRKTSHPQIFNWHLQIFFNPHSFFCLKGLEPTDQQS